MHLNKYILVTLKMQGPIYLTTYSKKVENMELSFYALEYKHKLYQILPRENNNLDAPKVKFSIEEVGEEHQIIQKVGLAKS